MLFLNRKIQMKNPQKSNQLSHAVRNMIAFTCLAIIPIFSYAQNDKKPAAADEQKQMTIAPITVTVTAQKESEPALSVPLSVTAVTQDSLTGANIQAVKQAADYAPNIFINEFSARALSNPFFRGIGGSPTNPAVSTSIDGVPQLNSFSSNIELIDVGQIEFVRGPEGTLYGRNTAGGLINITSRPMPEVWTFQGQGEYGNYDRQGLRANVSSPLLKDRVGMSLSGGYSSRDGYTENDRAARDLDSRSARFGKGQLFFKISDRFKIRLIISGEHDNDGDYALGDLAYIRKNPNHVSRDFTGYNHRSVGDTTLVADYSGSRVNFSSITGGVWWRNHALTDLDYQTASLANYGLYAVRDSAEQQHQFTQEFRFTSAKPVKMTDALNMSWQAGVFIFNQSYWQDAANDITSFQGHNITTSTSSLDDAGVGVYGKAKFTAWKNLDVTAGLRFDYEDKSADVKSAIPSLITITGSYSQDFSEISPQFSVAHHFLPDQMTYASVSRGYKAGGYNPAPTGFKSPAGTESYDPEHTWNYELGHKAGWLNNRLQTTVALFYVDWDNLQLNQQLPFSGGQYYIGNSGRANSKGLEFETKVRPFSWWELFGSVGYTRARFLLGSRAYNANMDMNQNVSGNTLPFAPAFTANMGTQISWTLCRQTSLYLRIQSTRLGEFQYDASNAMSQPDYQLTGFRGGVRTKRFFAEGWVDNAFDAHYVPIAIPYAQLLAPSGYIGESGTPRTYGFRLGLNY
jgi:iron complex outermembrane recepter protein